MNDKTKSPRLAGIELGGTKSIAVLANGHDILEQATFPTTTPDETLPLLAEKLQAWNAEARLAALGIASFGPLQLSPNGTDYGHMLPTPKAGWSGFNITHALTIGLDCPVAIDTDVNAAALAEHRWGAGAEQDSVCYITIGTGVGGGLVLNGRPVHGAMHPEIGHLRIRSTSGFAGACPFHGDCIEGLVSGPALAARFGVDPKEVPESDPRWQAVASDIAELIYTILITTAAQRVLIGGGVGMARPFLLDIARKLVVERLQGYLPYIDESNAAEIIRTPALGQLAGPLGAIALAQTCLPAPSGCA